MQDSRYYEIISSGSDQNDDEEITGVLSLMKNAPQTNDLMLLNYFNEIPICFAATIEDVDRGVVEMTANKIQIVALKDQKITFLDSASLKHNVFAKVQRIDIENNKVLLTCFSYAHIYSSRREYVRVKVKSKLAVFFESDKFSVNGFLYDISIGGLSILASTQADTEAGVKGTVSICLTGTKLEVTCRLLRILDCDGLKKYVLKLDSSPKIEILISQFIYQIQYEAIRELKDRANGLDISQEEAEA